MNDLISRQAAIEAFWKLDVEMRPSVIDAIIEMLKQLPSAQPERKHGEWLIDKSGSLMCSKCGTLLDEFQKPSRFCPNCGASMRGWKDDATD